MKKKYVAYSVKYNDNVNEQDKNMTGKSTGHIDRKIGILENT